MVKSCCEESYSKTEKGLCLVQSILEVYESSTETRQAQDDIGVINAHANTAWELRKKCDLT